MNQPTSFGPFPISDLKIACKATYTAGPFGGLVRNDNGTLINPFSAAKGRM